jgi:hypothetical protein
MLTDRDEDELDVCRSASIMTGMSIISAKPKVMRSSMLDCDPTWVLGCAFMELLPL